MQIYQKQYRVKFEKDKYGKKCEFTYIPCSRYKGMEIYRNGDNVIGVYIPSINVGKRIAKEYPLLFRIEKETSCEIVLLFDEVDINKAGEILKAKKKVKRILTESQIEILRKRVQEWNIKNTYKNTI